MRYEEIRRCHSIAAAGSRKDHGARQSYELYWLIVMMAIPYIPDKVAISGPMLLLAELIVLACGIDAQTNDASGSALRSDTLTSFKRHRNSLDCESPKAAHYSKVGHQLPRKWKAAKEMVGRRLTQAEAKRLLAKFE